MPEKQTQSNVFKLDSILPINLQPVICGKNEWPKSSTN